MRKRVIVVTDGDRVARRAVERAAANVGGRTISASAGNPTPLSGGEICSLVRSCDGDPVVVMVDDRGHAREGKGESALRAIAADSGIELLGVVAVASNTHSDESAAVDFSISGGGEVVDGPVDKEGSPEGPGMRLKGDTVAIVDHLEVPVVVGIGDPGKMAKADDAHDGAPVLTEALRQILARSRR